MAPTFVQVFLGLAAVLSAASAVSAETHTISFDNQCGKGTPQLLVGGKVVSTGEPYTFNGIISSAIAYLQTGDCGFNGEGCTLMEMTLVNPTAPGSGSSTDISLIPPHALNVPASFSYYGGSCNGQGASCDSGSCTSAFHVFNDNQVQVQCETDNANLLISFCGNAATNELVVGGSGGNKPAAPSSSASHSSVRSTASASPASSPAPAKAPAKATPTPAKASTSSAPSSTPSVDRGSCKNKKRMMRRRATTPELEARALHDVHARSH